MKKLLWFIIACLALVTAQVTTPAPAHACSCSHVPHTITREEVEQRDAVFVGKVVSIESKLDNDFEMNRAVRFEVTSAWKGVSQPQVTIYTGSRCGITFQVGEQWLVYADAWDGKPLRAMWCITNTAPLENEWAQSDLKALGQPEFVPGNANSGRSNRFAFDPASFGSIFSFLLMFLFSLQFLLPVAGLFR